MSLRFKKMYIVVCFLKTDLALQNVFFYQMKEKNCDISIFLGCHLKNKDRSRSNKELMQWIRLKSNRDQRSKNINATKTLYFMIYIFLNIFLLHQNRK